MAKGAMKGNPVIPVNPVKKTVHRDNPKLQPLVGEISRSKHLVIIGRCKDDLEREFYIRMTRKFGWTKNALALRIQAFG